MSVTPRGMSVQEAYREYRDGAFRVNRQYQRKLVWTLDEKRKLIDSILRGYPIPLILLATRILDDGAKEFEILDGMQRLNAVFSFIENRYDIENKFFDVNQLSRARQLAESGEISVESHEDLLLSPENCADFLDYTLAVTEFPATDPEAVNDVFGRINAFGRHLSPQEQRQAGVVGVFANTIRELAAEIRGDVSTESLDLSAMPEVSVDVGGETDDYGIKADDTFWCKQGILRRGQLRDSEDEQLLADLAISILQEEPFAFSGKNLNEAYDPEQALFHSTNEQVVVYGADALKHDIQATISILRDTIEEVDPGSNALRRIVHPDGGSNPIKTAFYAVFMAFFELCVKEEKSPRDSAGIMASLENLQSRLHVSAGQIRSEPRRQNIDATKGMIQSLFEDRVPPATRSGPGVSIRFENALRRSKIETSAFECKQGLLRLDDSRSKDDGLLGRIVKTICGIANLGPDSSGAVFIGVADSDEDKNRVETLDNIRSLKIGSRYVVGIDRELNPLSIDLDSYMQQIVAHISDSALSEPLKSSVLGSIDCISYRGLSVICIWIPEQGEVSHVGDVVFARTGSETRKVEGLTQTQAIMERFS